MTKNKESKIISEKTEQIINDYALALKSEKSRKEYYYIIRGFCDYCGKDYLKAGVEDFKLYFESMKTAAKNGEKSHKTIGKVYSVLSNFSAYIVSNAENYGITGFYNHLMKIAKPEISHNITIQNIPSMEQLDKIYTAAQNDALMYCVIALVNKCALTVDQICNLQMRSFIMDSENNCGMIFPYQYSADRYIKLPDDVRDILNDYVAIAREAKGDYLFCNKRGGQITPRVLQNRMQMVVERAAGEEEWKFSLQDIRNMSAVLMLKGGGEADEVADYIGIQTQWMQRYDRAVVEFAEAPCDYINLSIRRFTDTDEN